MDRCTSLSRRLRTEPWSWNHLSAMVLAMCAAAPAVACQLQTVAVLHLEMNGNSPLVDVSINGQPARMLIDTGAQASLLTRPAALAYNLELRALEGVTIYGVGGYDVSDRVVIDDFQLGTLKVHKVQLFVAGRHGFGQAAGLLGENILSRWDAEFDFAHGAVRLFQPKGCSGDEVVYWGGGYSVSQLQSSAQTGYIQTVLELNGNKTLALWDSGAYVSTVTTDAARLAGVALHSDDVQKSGHARGIGSNEVDSYVTVFSTFKVGDEQIQNAKLRIADLFGANKSTPTFTRIPRDITQVPGMLLGADFFLSHRIYVARSQNKVYFSYAGGPVFSTREPEVREEEGDKGGGQDGASQNTADSSASQAQPSDGKTDAAPASESGKPRG
ncbi:MAG TPA: retropepsin-like aspartic protease [Steroidobacteraceae bacterium]|nr:retropepsin-like aspartic protease [Steroidobacteraceae bacterium]